MISSAKPEDSGRYECVAESTSGHRASLAAKLLVDHDTRIPETSEYTLFSSLYAIFTEEMIILIRETHSTQIQNKYRNKLLL